MDYRQKVLENLIKTRAEQILRKYAGLMTLQNAVNQARDDIIQAMYVCEYLKSTRDLLRFDKPIDVTSPEFEVALSLVCGMNDGWDVEKIGDDTIVSPKVI